MSICIPFIHSVKGYGLYWDNYSPTMFTDNPQEMSFDSEVGDCADYYFIYGSNADGVIAGVRDLTGQAPLYPLGHLDSGSAASVIRVRMNCVKWLMNTVIGKFLWMESFRIGSIGDVILTGTP